ncbi:MAG: DMT family transporter [Patescibacteria group bacterium]|nr:DMT family transporter [Patescibacteria group bacterium]
MEIGNWDLEIINNMGLLFAIIAMFCWGTGDFLIQKDARRFGVWMTMFFITAFGTVILLPFVWQEIPTVFENSGDLWLLIATAVAILAAGLMEFQALKVGKISVIEPIFTLEVFSTLLLAFFIIQEKPSWPEFIAIIFLVSGVALVSLKKIPGQKKNWREKISNFLLRPRHKLLEIGVILAIFAAVIMGAVNFLFGLAARQTTPLLTMWFTNLCLSFICYVYILSQIGHKEIATDWKNQKRLILATVFFDNLAWIAYAFSATHLPIAIATAFSEGYIVLAAILGLIFNREKLQHHQFFGIILAIIAAIALALVSPEI